MRCRRHRNRYRKRVALVAGEAALPGHISITRHGAAGFYRVWRPHPRPNMKQGGGTYRWKQADQVKQPGSPVPMPDDRFSWPTRLVWPGILA